MTDPGYTIWISNRQNIAVDEDDLRTLALTVLVGEGVAEVELSVSLVDDGEMQSLHLRYLNEPGPTDVLAFAQDEGNDGAGRLLGDVVIDPKEASRNSPSYPAAEVRLLLVHGILHLLGYDHEAEEDRSRMWERQERYSGVRVQ